MGSIKFSDSGLELPFFVLQTTKKDGNMSNSKLFYPEGIPESQIEQSFQGRAIAVCNKYGIKGMFKTLQKPWAGNVRVVDDELCSHINDERKCVSVEEQALIITDNYPKYVIGHAVADCPVVMLFDSKRGIIATAHCGGLQVNNGMVDLLVNEICKFGGSSQQDLLAYVSMGAGPNWTYDCYPRWANHSEVWNPTSDNQFITSEEDGIFKIDIKSAIRYQLEKAKLDKSNILVSEEDTLGFNSEYYSNHDRQLLGEEPGLNFAGAGFDLEDSQEHSESKILVYRR